MSQTSHPFGRHFLVGLQPSATLTEHDRRLLEALSPAGIILFKGNFEQGAPYPQWLATYQQLIADVRSAIGRERIIVSIDHEGGRVYRPPVPITNFAYAREWAPQPEAVGSAMGVELRSLGINVVLAPVVDVDSNPENPVIGPRSFGTTPQEVIRAALPFIRAVEGEGITTCPKHFPGHGDTSVDSHRELPTVSRDREQLERMELAPFQAVIDAGARLIMTSHVLFPALDPAQPATLSRPITTGLLRDEMGYQGVILTDDVGMHAVSEQYHHAGAATRTIRAGVDLIDICAFGLDTSLALAMADEIAEAHRTGDLPDEEVSASKTRIERLLSDLPQHGVEMLPEQTFRHHASLAPLHDRTLAHGVGTWEQSVDPNQAT